MPTKQKHKSGGYTNGGGHNGNGYPLAPPSNSYRTNHHQPQPPFGFYYNSSSPNSRMATPGASSVEGRRYEDHTTPTYSVEHLATFGYGAQFGLHSPLDGIRKLKQMELSQAIWAQKMILRLKHDSVVVEDENGEVVETFPINLVSDPSAHLSTDPRDVYNNLLVFVVNEDKQKRSTTPTEMHIFQCVRISANDVVDDVKKFLTGRGSSVAPGRHETGFLQPSEPFHQQQPPAPSHQPLKTPTNGYHARSDDTSLNFERDVNMLNRCFDDIERFVARIQQAAMIQREYEKKRGNRPIQLPPQFPAEMEFHEILQKFKYCFNLLAKLKNHIHEPNAPELLHFLFTPFTVILDACNWGIGQNVAHRVYNPPITHDAKTLLQNSLTSRETEVWISLGDAWTVPAPHQNGSKPASVLDFGVSEPGHSTSSNAGNGHLQMDLLLDGIKRVTVQEERLKKEKEEIAKRERELKQKELVLQHREQEIIERSSRTTPDNDIPSPQPLHPYTADDFVYRPNYNGSTGLSSPAVVPDASDMLANESPRQRAFLEDLKSRRAKSVQVTYDRVGQNPKELTVSKGEFLEVLNDSKKWWECRNIHNRIGYVPHTILSIVYDGVESRPVSIPVAVKTNPPVAQVRQQPYSNGKGHNNVSPAQNFGYADDRQDEIINYDDEKYYHRNSYYIDEPSYDEEMFHQQERRHRDRNGDENYHRAQQPRTRNDQFDDEPRWQPNQRVPSPKRMMATTGVQTANVRNSEVQTEDHRPASMSTVVPQAPQAPILVKSSIPPAPSLPAPQPSKPTSSIQVTHTERPFENGSIDASGRTQTNIHIQKRMEEELKKTLKDRDLDNWRKTKQSNLNDPMINEYSPTTEIRNWLLEKGFSPRTISVLEGQSGATLFALSKNQLQQFCGSDEGKLLYSQLLVQKSLSGYDTKTNAELKAILQVRKSKAETTNQTSTAVQPETNQLKNLFINTNGETANGAQS